jgi:ribosomal protein S18 acetylase RimI-like enzyme
MKIRIAASESAPLALLLIADPSIKKVRDYLRTGTLFIGEENGAVVAVAVLDLSAPEVELKNIAIMENRQGCGLGRRMLSHVLAYAAKSGASRVVVGTGNSSLRELAFYQKNGFRVVGVIPGYFDDHYPTMIENGIACRDMIRLAIDTGAPCKAGKI